MHFVPVETYRGKTGSFTSVMRDTLRYNTSGRGAMRKKGYVVTVTLVSLQRKLWVSTVEEARVIFREYRDFETLVYMHVARNGVQIAYWKPDRT